MKKFIAVWLAVIIAIGFIYNKADSDTELGAWDTVKRLLHNTTFTGTTTIPTANITTGTGTNQTLTGRITASSGDIDTLLNIAGGQVVINDSLKVVSRLTGSKVVLTDTLWIVMNGDSLAIWHDGTDVRFYTNDPTFIFNGAIKLSSLQVGYGITPGMITTADANEDLIIDPNGSGKTYILGGTVIGDTLTATTDRYLYFGTDGSYTTEYLKWDEATTKFIFSDSLSAEGYIDGSSVYDGDAVTAIKNIKAKAGSVKDASGFKELDHKSLPAGVYTKLKYTVYRDKKTGISLPEGTVPPDTLVTYKNKKTGIFLPSVPDSLLTDYNIIKTPRNEVYDTIVNEREGRNISELISVLVKANQELVARVEALENK